MSDPREIIARTVMAPPPASSREVALRAAMSRPIGKAHGRMRCVNLSLTPAAREELYARSLRDSITLGEALMDALEEAGPSCIAARRPGRSAAVRRGVVVSPVYVLLTPAEATNLAAEADRSQRSMSDFASRLLCNCSAKRGSRYDTGT